MDTATLLTSGETDGETRLGRLCARITPQPARLYCRGADLEHLLALPRVAIVGSRKISAYGKAVTTQLAGELAEQGIVIVSGLAIGVDAVAHSAALEAGGRTFAILPGPIEQMYPPSHDQLAQRILRQDGALVSEYPAGMPTLKHQFIERNRLVCGLADVLLITEAAINSGTMHTARFALEQGKDVLVVPGNITSSTSEGTNNLLKTGAAPVTATRDVLHILGLASIQPQTRAVSGTPEEQHILALLLQGASDGSDLLARSKLSVGQFNHVLTLLEITGKVKALGNDQWGLG